MNRAPKTLNIVGCGRVGKTLGSLFQEHAVFKIQGVMNRTPEAARKSVSFIGAGEPVTEIAGLGPADVWLIAASDQTIEECGRLIASRGVLRSGDTLFHCSGALPSSLLRAQVTPEACCVASVHPILTFADPSIARQAFSGVLCGIEGDSPAVALLAEAIQEIGARVFSVLPEQKLAYHAASVFSSNLLVAMFEVAHRLHCGAGVTPELSAEVLQQMMKATLYNIEVLGTAKALTGPVSRGDAELVRNQVECLDRIDVRIGETYRLLSEFALQIAGRQGVLTPDEQRRVQDVLKR
jgi:predicted short-subunit dehydrogenase-like oxidoreductase (DUF2520 family)